MNNNKKIIILTKIHNCEFCSGMEYNKILCFCGEPKLFKNYNNKLKCENCCYNINKQLILYLNPNDHKDKINEIKKIMLEVVCKDKLFWYKSKLVNNESESYLENALENYNIESMRYENYDKVLLLFIKFYHDDNQLLPQNDELKIELKTGVETANKYHKTLFYIFVEEYNKNYNLQIYHKTLFDIFVKEYNKN